MRWSLSNKTEKAKKTQVAQNTKKKQKQTPKHLTNVILSL